MDAVFFDFNGVLVDDEHLHLSGFNAVLSKFGVHLDAAEYEARYIGFDDRGAFAHALRDHGLDCDAAQLAALIDEKAAFYAAAAARELCVFEGAARLLREAAARAPVAVVSGALRAEIVLGLGVLGASGAPRCIVAAEDVSACKPDPEGYLLALKTLRAQGLSLDPARVVVIEDTPAGVAAGRAAGLTVVGVGHSVAPEKLRAAGAVQTVKHLREMHFSMLEAAAATVIG
ncbi:MAG: HAD family phosphatase [Myxococcales bacterium]|nr:HAD family phosphatase [Myxococcales bacterium]